MFERKASWLVVALIFAGGLLSGGNACAMDVHTVWLDELDLSHAVAGWGTTQEKRSVDGNELSMNGTTYERGIGTHAPGYLVIKLDKGTRRFHALVGIDDEVGDGPGSVEFMVAGDGQEITVKWSDLGIEGQQVIRDLWRQKDVGTSSECYTVEVPPHGVVLVKIAEQ